jgi:hypothetical protein
MVICKILQTNAWQGLQSRRSNAKGVNIFGVLEIKMIFLKHVLNAGVLTGILRGKKRNERYGGYL